MKNTWNARVYSLYTSDVSIWGCSYMAWTIPHSNEYVQKTTYRVDKTMNHVRDSTTISIRITSITRSRYASSTLDPGPLFCYRKSGPAPSVVSIGEYYISTVICSFHRNIACRIICTELSLSNMREAGILPGYSKNRQSQLGLSADSIENRKKSERGTMLNFR